MTPPSLVTQPPTPPLPKQVIVVPHGKCKYILSKGNREGQPCCEKNKDGYEYCRKHFDTKAAKEEMKAKGTTPQVIPPQPTVQVQTKTDKELIEIVQNDSSETFSIPEQPPTPPRRSDEPYLENGVKIIYLPSLEVEHINQIKQPRETSSPETIDFTAWEDNGNPDNNEEIEKIIKEYYRTLPWLQSELPIETREDASSEQ